MTRLFVLTITSIVTPTFLRYTHTYQFTSHTIESLLGQEFETMAKARDSIKETIINAGLSYKTLKAKSMCYILVCKGNTYIRGEVVWADTS